MSCCNLHVVYVVFAVLWTEWGARIGLVCTGLVMMRRSLVEITRNAQVAMPVHWDEVWQYIFLTRRSLAAMALQSILPCLSVVSAHEQAVICKARGAADAAYGPAVSVCGAGENRVSWPFLFELTLDDSSWRTTGQLCKPDHHLCHICKVLQGRMATPSANSRAV